MTSNSTPSVSDEPPQGDELTEYDLAHRVTYLRLLDANTAGADWAEVAKLVLGIDPAAEPERARAVYTRHLVRARWMTKVGYKLMRD